MRTIAVTNHKGGSAKTTTTVNVAAALGEGGRRVLVIDMDPQGSASAWLGVPEPEEGVIDAIHGRSPLAQLVYETTAPGVQLVPASPGLVAADRRDEMDIALGFVRAMERLPSMWDIVLVDCPPSLGYLAIAPLTICGEVLLPVEAHVLALGGITALLETMDRIRNRLNPDLKLSAVLACRVNRTSHARSVAARLERRFPESFMRTQVRESIRLAEAPSFRLPITRYAPESTGAEDYRAVAAELVGPPSLNRPAARLVSVTMPAVPATERAFVPASSLASSASDVAVSVGSRLGKLWQSVSFGLPSGGTAKPPTEGPTPADPSGAPAARPRGT